ncbi:hypothetical protein LCGC14_2325960 [marine sediment metagenome]|uniref:Uncharacterized protein n=1 Tax=marine sediment metagenome TaxID=412755 RepID=A0A0F9ETV6_9ZZZZ
MIDDLKQARRLIHEAINELERSPEKEIVSELIAACKRIDIHYKEACEEIDAALREKKGTAYRDGWNMEYYIESSLWHDVSVQLRKLEDL